MSSGLSYLVSLILAFLVCNSGEVSELLVFLFLVILASSTYSSELKLGLLLGVLGVKFRSSSKLKLGSSPKLFIPISL